MKNSVVIFFIFLVSLFLSFPTMLGGACQDYSLQVQEPAPAKKTFPRGYFIVPTDSVLKIAGNFGEIRPNHFHAGLDIKTGGREGTHVLAAADGYVSRIKISPYGYGKCLYITHPNGFVTVYGHLQRLYGKIAEYLEQEQYKAESYDLDIYPEKNLLKVKQRDTVAISGNTGGSQSPHVHFEIRDEKTEHAYNPLLFGFKIDDTVSPSITMLAVYPANDSSRVNGKDVSRKMRVYGSRGSYKIPPGQITVHGDIGFGIETTDYATVREYGKLGAYSIELDIDGKRIYYHELNEIGFDESRYINSHIDYAEEARSNRAIQKCFRDENNMLSIYQCVVNDGLFRFEDNLSHPVKFVVKDFFGNTSVLEFKVKSSKSKVQPLAISHQPSAINHFNCCDLNKFETDNIKVEIPPCTLYSNIDFHYSMSKDTLPGKFSPVHVVDSPEVPLNSNYSLSIRAKPIPKQLQTKATIVLLDGNNTMKDEGGTYGSLTPTLSKGEGAPSPLEKAGDEAWVTTQTRFFGRFAVTVDTVAPSIKPYNISNGRNMSGSKILAVKIGDNLTGIKSYRGTVDGKWIAMQFEYKNAMLFYEFDEHVGKGKHTFQVEVTDGKNNVRSYKAEFVR